MHHPPLTLSHSHCHLTNNNNAPALDLAVPLILKGVQCWEDALQAYDAGLAGVVLSNHGGRQLDFARSGIEVLAEVVRELGARRALAFPNERFQLFVDGGVRRANDVLKAVALGATAVGVGRPFLYAYSAYGFAGVDHALGILRDEFEMNMRLIGARRLEEIRPEMVDAAGLRAHIVPVPGDRLFDSNCEWPLAWVPDRDLGATEGD